MTSLTPPMTLSATYHETHTPLKSSTPPQPYIASTGPTNTPIVTVNYGRSHEPQRHVGTDAYLKTSLSSSTSGGSAASDLKPIPPTHQYRFASLAESGLMNASRRPRSHDERSRSHHNTPSICDQLDMVENNSAVLQYLQQRELEGRDPEEEDHAIWILFWLGCLDPIHSLFSCLFSIVILIGTLVVSPLSLCRKEWSFSISLIRTIAPVYRSHLQIMYAPSVQEAHTFDFSPTRLILIHILSPFLSIGIAACSWVAAVFWVFAIILGNPDGTEKRDDGRHTVLLLRDWWEKCLLTAIRR